MTDSSNVPKVSIGLPVYNGEKYVELALKSLLAQTFHDLEVIVCDNASTDATQEIVTAIAATDCRVRYVRNPENLGAAKNYNKCFQLARGMYFKWAAHDDECDPEFLRACVEILDQNTDAVVAHTGVRLIDPEGKPIGDYHGVTGLDSSRASVRYKALTAGHKCYEVFGLIRADVLRKTPLIAPYAHSDGVLLAELALHGRFLKCERPLFMPRLHPGQSMTMIGDYRKYTEWFDPTRKGEWAFPYWRICREFLFCLFRVPLSLRIRMECFNAWVAHLAAHRRVLRGDVTYQIRRMTGALPRTVDRKPAT